jgi:hypothetical protein
MLVVKSLQLQRKNSWTNEIKNMGPLEGKVQFVNSNQCCFEVAMTPEQTRKVIEILAESLVTSAEDLGRLLKADVIESAGETRLLT